MNTLTNLKYTLAVTAGLCSSFAYAQNHPHIILIMTDQQRADAIGCMGNDAVISPNLDALAAEGTLFMNGYSSCPSSTPARAGLLTGLSPWHHGLLGYGKVSPCLLYTSRRENDFPPAICKRKVRNGSLMSVHQHE